MAHAATKPFKCFLLSGSSGISIPAKILFKILLLVKG